MSFISEFKAFALRGNVIDLAVAVVIGTAFNKIVSAMVDGIIMPMLGLILGGIDLSGKQLIFHHAIFKWGELIQSVIDFTLIAFSIFIAIKMLNTFTKKQEEAPQITKEVTLLTEIRDLLAKNNVK